MVTVADERIQELNKSVPPKIRVKGKEVPVLLIPEWLPHLRVHASLADLRKVTINDVTDFYDEYFLDAQLT